MYNKTMNKLKILFIALLIGLICANPVLAYPSNSVVRVGIMDQKYTTVEKSEVVIYGTKELVLTDFATKEEIARIPEGAELQIKRCDEKFELYYIEPLTEIEMGAEIKNDFVITSPAGILGIKDLTRGGKPAQYRGEFRILACSEKPDKFCLINCLDVEYYLKGVVPCEMPVHFGLEALKAQAVAARVYSLTPRTKVSRCYDVVDSVASQVYNGYNRESEISNKAIDETHGIVALHNDNMIVAVFCSTAGGYIESYANTFSDTVTGQFPSPNRNYLISKPDLPEIKPLNKEEDAFKFYSTKPLSYDINSPLYRWTKSWTKNELQNILKSTLIVQSKTGFVEPKLTNSDDFGNLKDIRVLKRGDSGKIITMEVVTDKNTFTIGKELVIRRVFQKEGKALPSANVVFKTECESESDKEWSKITAYGGGYGHGCGLSQFGARYMAQNCNLPFDIILKHYYNSIILGTKPVELSKTQVTQCFYQPFKKAVLVIPDRKDVSKITLKINEQELTLDLSANKRSEIDISKYINSHELNTISFNPLIQPKYDRHHHVQPVRSIKLYIRIE